MGLLSAESSVTDRIEELLQQAESLKYKDKLATMNLAKEALQLSEDENDLQGQIKSLVLVAYCYHHTSEPQNFFKHIFRVFELLEDAPDPSTLSYSKYLCACSFRNVGDFNQAVENFLSSLEIAEQIDDKESVIRCLNGLGHLYNMLGSPDKALEHYERGLSYAKEFGSPELIGNLLGNKADVLILQGKLEQARPLLETFISIYEKLGDGASIGHGKLRLGKLLIAEGKVQEGLQVMFDLIDSARSTAFRFGVSFVAKEIADVLIKLDRSDEALEYLNESLEISKDGGFFQLLTDLYLLFFKCYEKREDHKQALKYYQLYHEGKEKINSREVEMKLKNAESLNEIQLVKKEAEIHRLKHIELRRAYEEIEVKNKEITDSIVYARRIQSALLPVPGLLEEKFKEHFLLYLPKNIVSGDFYWMSGPVNGDLNARVVVVADCTGHGVPGALMSMIGSMLLNQIVNERGIGEPSEVLEQLDVNLHIALKTNKQDNRDGMDVSAALVNFSSGEIIISSAMRPVWVYRNAEKQLIDIPPTKRSIGGYADHETVPFISSRTILNSMDRVYLFSDGFADQFGGEKGKKMMVRNFKSLILETINLDLHHQGKALADRFNQWRGPHEQVDDVTVLGFSVK